MEQTAEINFQLPQVEVMHIFNILWRLLLSQDSISIFANAVGLLVLSR